MHEHSSTVIDREVNLHEAIDHTDHHDHIPHSLTMHNHAAHGEIGHVCSAECEQTQTQANALADNLFATSSHNHAAHGELGHVCSSKCEQTQIEADALAETLFTTNAHSHNHAAHGEIGHVCTAECEQTQISADRLASELFEQAAPAHGEGGHVCTTECEHTQVQADKLANDLFGAPTSSDESPSSSQEYIIQTSEKSGDVHESSTSQNSQEVASEIDTAHTSDTAESPSQDQLIPAERSSISPKREIPTPPPQSEVINNLTPVTIPSRQIHQQIDTVSDAPTLSVEQPSQMQSDDLRTSVPQPSVEISTDPAPIISANAYISSEEWAQLLETPRDFITENDKERVPLVEELPSYPINTLMGDHDPATDVPLYTGTPSEILPPSYFIDTNNTLDASSTYPDLHVQRIEPLLPTIHETLAHDDSNQANVNALVAIDTLINDYGVGTDEKATLTHDVLDTHIIHLADALGLEASAVYTTLDIDEESIGKEGEHGDVIELTDLQYEILLGLKETISAEDSSEFTFSAHVSDDTTDSHSLLRVLCKLALRALSGMPLHNQPT